MPWRCSRDIPTFDDDMQYMAWKLQMLKHQSNVDKSFKAWRDEFLQAFMDHTCRDWLT